MQSKADAGRMSLAKGRLVDREAGPIDTQVACPDMAGKEAYP